MGKGENVKMEKELKELLKDFSELLDKIGGDTKSSLSNDIDKAFREKASISITKDEEGKSEMHTKGTTLAILITLAGLEKGLLEQLDVPNTLWEIIKCKVGARKANDNE